MKTLAYYNYTGVKEVTSGSLLPMTNTIRQYGNNISLSDNQVIIKNTCNSNIAGYYNVYINTNLTAGSDGTVSVSLYQDGDMVQGAVQTQTVSSGDIVTFGFTAPIRIFCGQTQTVLELYTNGQTVNTLSVSMEIVKE